MFVLNCQVRPAARLVRLLRQVWQAGGPPGADIPAEARRHPAARGPGN